MTYIDFWTLSVTDGVSDTPGTDTVPYIRYSPIHQTNKQLRKHQQKEAFKSE